MKTGTLSALVLVLLASTQLALAQKPTTKKKGTKPAADTAEPAPAPEPAAAPESKPAPPPADEEKTEKKPDKAATSAATENAPDEAATSTHEKKGERYYFPGIRYRVTVIPQFIVNLFVNEGATFVSHTIGAELDMRKDDQSIIPWIAYQSFGTGDTLFLQKNGVGDPTQPANWSVVNSSLGALFLGLDEQWSVPLDENHHFDFEYGFGVGLGVLFGTLHNNWVYETATTGPTAGPLVSSTGRHFAACPNQNQQPGALPSGVNSCNVSGHQNPNAAKVNNYSESNWFGGGPVPVLFPHISIPQVGIRYKPVKQFEMRLGVGFSLTGFWLGLSGNYGLEKTQSSGGEESRPEPEKKDSSDK
jgi:hypothetical protein